MNIAVFEVYRYRLPLKNPIVIKRHHIRVRQGMIIRLINAKGNFGYGEISPLPGLNKESFKDARRQILALRNHILDGSIPEGVTRLDGKFEAWLGRFHLYPSVRFGIEMAVLNLLGNSSGQPFCRLVTRTMLKEIVINGLAWGTRKEIYRQIQEFRLFKFKSIKLKVGNVSLRQSIETINDIRTVMPYGTKLRLDANRRWDLQRAVSFGKAVGKTSIEYIEEPCTRHENFFDFFKTTGIPVAVDESLQKIPASQLKPGRGIHAVIIKPTVIGGLEQSMQLIRRVEKHGIKAVVSSSFETGLGLCALGNLAVCLGKRALPAGLDTAKWFTKDILKNKGIFTTGRISISKLAGMQNQVYLNLCKRIV